MKVVRRSSIFQFHSHNALFPAKLLANLARLVCIILLLKILLELIFLTKSFSNGRITIFNLSDHCTEKKQPLCHSNSNVTACYRQTIDNCQMKRKGREVLHCVVTDETEGMNDQCL